MTNISKSNESTENNSSSLSEAEKFLESLNLPDSEETVTETDSKDIMSFLDEISNYPIEDTTTIKKGNSEVSTEPIKETVTTPIVKEQLSTPATENQLSQEQGTSWTNWGNSFWNQATAAVKTTTEQINLSVGSDSATKLLEGRVKTLQNLVNKENIEKLSAGLKNLTTTLLETVAPPISEHEIVEIWLSYDMIGYTGLESLVYRSFSQIMDNTEGGQVVVRNPDTSDDNKRLDPALRDLNMCDSVLDGTKLAKANIDYLIKQHYATQAKKEPSVTQTSSLPVIHCPVFMTIQPVKANMIPIEEDDLESQQFFFIVMMIDPTHRLKFKTYSQLIPLRWLEIPYDENEWVEDKIVDVLHMSVALIAQDYVWTRSGTPKSIPEEEEQVHEV